MRSALAFARRCHAGQRRTSDGAAFIEHPIEVARLLRDAGCREAVVAAGLLHDVIEDTDVSAPELSGRFGSDVTNLVRAVTEDSSIDSFRQRKRGLREQVRAAGREAALLFAADKVAKVCELSHRLAPAARADPDDELRLEHYHESLRMLESLAPGHRLVTRLARELENCLLTRRRDPVPDRA